MNQFASNIAVLRRWAALSDHPLPAHFKDFREQYSTESFQIQEKDPELVTLLSGNAPAGLVADVLSGNWPDVTPSPEERQRQSQQEELQQLYDAKPFGGLGANGDPLPENLTAQLQLAALSPEIAARSQTEATNSFSPENPDLAAKVKAAAIAKQRRAVTESHEHGQRLARAQAPMVHQQARIKAWQESQNRKGV